MPRKKKIAELSQVHGKVEDFKPTTLDQIWGDDGLTKYQTLNEDQYKNFLSDMGKTELHAHCGKVGVVPIDNREMLEKKLVIEFLKHVNSYRVPNNKTISTSLSKDALDVLKEGK